MTGTVRRLVLVLGDQLTLNSPALKGLDPARDRVLMIEAPGEATGVWSHKARIALFISAMRHFRDALREAGYAVEYVSLDDSDEPTLTGRLAQQLQRWQPEVLRLLEPGEWRLQQGIAATATDAGVALQWLDDTHFLCSRADFARWAGPYRGSLRMEYFYREMRRLHRVLIDHEAAKPDQPEGGLWNYDADNRQGYPKRGPGLIPPPEVFEPDALTREVLAEVERRFPNHPGSLAQSRPRLCLFQTTRWPCACQRFHALRPEKFGSLWHPASGEQRVPGFDHRNRAAHLSDFHLSK